MQPTPSIELIPVAWRRSCHAAIALTRSHGPFDDPDAPAARRLSQQARSRIRRWIHRQQAAGAAGLLSDIQLRLLDQIPADWRAVDQVRQFATRAESTDPDGKLRKGHNPQQRRGRLAGAARTGGQDRVEHRFIEQVRCNGTADREARRVAMADRFVPAAAAALAAGNFHPRYAAVLRVRVEHPEDTTRQLGARLGITASAYDGRLRRALGLRSPADSQNTKPHRSLRTRMK